MYVCKYTVYNICRYLIIYVIDPIQKKMYALEIRYTNLKKKFKSCCKASQTNMTL